MNQSLKTAMRAMWVAGAWLSIWVSAACLAATGPDYGVNLEGAKAANAAVHVTQFWQDTYFGNPENPRTTGHGLSAIGDPAPIFKDGRYTSPYQGFELLIPRVGESTNVILAQALVSKRADGTPITTDIVLTMPGKSAYALVVTRMRDDRPKDTDTGLSEFEPKTANEREALERNGVRYQRRNGPLGLSLERLVKDRIFSELFPYRMVVDRSSPGRTVGLTRFVILGEFLCEFSIIIEAKPSQTSEALIEAAEADMDMFMGALVKAPQLPPPMPPQLPPSRV